MRSPTEVGTVAPMATILTLSEQFAVFHIVIISAAPRAEEGVVAGAVGPGVIEEVAGMMDLIVCEMFAGRRAVNDARGDAVIGIGVGQSFGALEALLRDVGQIFL